MKRTLIVTTCFVSLIPISDGLAQGIVIQERPVPVEIISQQVAATANEPLIPLADLARAFGSRLEYDPELERYWVQPTENGILELASRSARLPSHPSSEWPPGPRGVPSARSEFRVADWLVSRGIIIVGGKPHIPLADLATAMNSTVEPSDGAWTLVARPGAGPGFIRLSERGIIIINNLPQK